MDTKVETSKIVKTLAVSAGGLVSTFVTLIGLVLVPLAAIAVVPFIGLTALMAYSLWHETVQL